MHGCARPVVTAHGSVGPMASLKGNGQIRSADVLPQETLAMALSYRLRFTGTKLGRDQAVCGACTVLGDGLAHYSCAALTQASGENR